MKKLSVNKKEIYIFFLFVNLVILMGSS